jgi:hypothetical protein
MAPTTSAGLSELAGRHVACELHTEVKKEASGSDAPFSNIMCSGQPTCTCSRAFSSVLAELFPTMLIAEECILHLHAGVRGYA